MDLQLKEKVALVTGAARGVGAATARLLAREGAAVALLDRDLDAGAATARDLAAEGHDCVFLRADLTVDDEVERALAAAIGRFGRLDILVNNAAVNDRVSLRDGVNAFRFSLERNLVQVFACTHHALPHLIASQGCVVNVGSKVAVTGQGGTSGYAASKGGVHALTREWALELAGLGVRVNTVVPAEVWTPLYEAWLTEAAADPIAARATIEAAIPLGHRMSTCDEIAATVAFVASPRSSHTTGQLLFVDGGYVHLDRMCTVRPPGADS